MLHLLLTKEELTLDERLEIQHFGIQSTSIDGIRDPAHSQYCGAVLAQICVMGNISITEDTHHIDPQKTQTSHRPYLCIIFKFKTDICNEQKTICNELYYLYNTCKCFLNHLYLAYDIQPIRSCFSHLSLSNLMIYFGTTP